MEIALENLPALDLALMRVLSMPLRQRPRTVVRYDAPGREDHILHYAVSGVRVYRQQGREIFRLQPGDVILLPMGACYDTLVEGAQDAFGYNARFLLADEAGRAVGLSGGPQKLTQDGAGRLLPYFQRLSALSVQANALLPAKGCLAELLWEITRCRLTPQNGNWLTVATAYMGGHLQGPLSLGELASACQMSQRTFCRKFKAAMGKSPIAWHRELRIEKAREFLETGTYTLEAVAEALGFTDAAHLSRRFFAETGQRAGAARKASGSVTGRTRRD